jgi:hypothetical protein
MPPAQQTQPATEGTIETKLAGGRVLITRMRGYITGPLCERTFSQFRTEATRTTGGTWIIDTLALDGFQPSAVQVGARWFEVFKQQEGKAIIMVSGMAPVRMAAATLAFAVHIKVTSCKDMTEAYKVASLEPSSGPPFSSR